MHHIYNVNAGNVAEAHGYWNAIGLSNQADACMNAGQIDDAIALHQEALVLKLRFCPEMSIQTGITYNGLGAALIRAGRLDEADEVLQKAFTIRQAEGPRLDAADTRDNIGALREAQGRFEEAREMRLKGSEKNEIMCGNYKCTTHKLYALKNLSACGACKSVFYCSKACQVADWRSRHKPLCKAHTASQSSSKEQEKKDTEGGEQSHNQGASAQDVA
ncbi:hypothetical protein GGS26DRAFT_591567 [Hypomontagnella submonticulosa]|nr:hypothetical protein GGS26DRAFT_591567 [Hypomontagnella submonticulosa]